ncbi:MAG: hypothetical protein P8013_03640 [Candidatus Sulfobium sp.]|jgi:serine/threonine protein kinase
MAGRKIRGGPLNNVWPLDHSGPPDAAPDAASAVYSMGVILYEMLTGSLDTLGTKRLGELSGNVPPWLENLTLKCCQKEKAQRYPDLDKIFSVLVDLKKKQE